MENNVPQNNFNEENESSSFDIKIWIIRILKNWYLFFISISMFLTVAYFQNKSWFPIYRSSALVIIEEANKGKACLENNIDIFVDDSLKHLNRIYDAGIKKIYIFDNVYNRENNKYNRIYSFRDLYYNVIG